MPSPLTDAYFAELATLTGLSPQNWEDFVSCTEAEQLMIVQSYRDADWAQAPDRFAQVLTVLTVIGTIAGVVSGVGGAVGAIQALKSL